MKPKNLSARAKFTLLNILFCIMIAVAYSCGGGGSGGSSDFSGTGSARFSLALQDASANRSLFGQASNTRAAQIDCQTNGISTIEAQVKDANGEVIATGGPFDCAGGEGKIDNIEPGANYTVCLFALNSEGSIIFEGESGPFAVVVGEVSDAGLIVLEPINARLNGDFGGTGFGFDTYDFSPWTVLFDATFEGDGAGTYDELANSDENPQSGSLTYNLDSDGGLTATLSDGTVLNGILNTDNNILAVADTDLEDDLDDFIEMDVAIKKSSGLAAGILNGEYIGVRISSNRSTAYALLNFSGFGRGTYEFLADSNDPEELPQGIFSYSVLPDGTVSIDDVSEAFAWAGTVSSDGSVVSLVDTDWSGNEVIDMTVLIKTGSESSNASLEGDYIAVSFGFFTGGSFGQETNLWSISADGAGNMEFEILANSNGASDTFETTYTINTDDGSIRIERSGILLFDGIVRADGDVFTFVDTDTDDEFIEMGVAIRKTE